MTSLSTGFSLIELLRTRSSRPDGQLAPGLPRRVHLRGVLPCPPVLRVRWIAGRGGVEQPSVDLPGRVRLGIGRGGKKVLQVVRDGVEQVERRPAEDAVDRLVDAGGAGVPVRDVAAARPGTDE